MEMNKPALDGVRIADFSWAWAGPYATMLLALMGAEVIKIESNQRLDHVRLRALGFGVFRGAPARTTRTPIARCKSR